MASVNKVILIGNLGRDPEVRYAPSGQAIANLSVATTDARSDRGEVKEHTEWHRVVLFGKTAEVAAEYLKKGNLVYVEGRLQTRKWTDKDGIERASTEIAGDRMQMLGSRADPPRADEPVRSAEPARRPAKPKKAPAFDELADEIPF